MPSFASACSIISAGIGMMFGPAVQTSVARDRDARLDLHQQPPVERQLEDIGGIGLRRAMPARRGRS